MVSPHKLAPPPATRESFTSDEDAVNRPVVESVPRKIHFKADDVKVDPWVHFFAGGVAGMTGSLFTSPLDVVKTRLQSDQNAAMRSARLIPTNPISRGLFHIGDTFSIIGNVYRQEGIRALFKGLGPNLAGVVPARSVNFFTYSLGKDFLNTHFKSGEESPPWIHLLAGVNAGIVTSTVTNPIWLIKTRLQLDQKQGADRAYRNSMDAVIKIVRNEGFRALYRGLSASYLGTVESSLQWMLYEQMKMTIARREKRRSEQGIAVTDTDKFLNWFARSGAAGAAKFAASLLTYPHEVIRTRLRQAPMENGSPKYKGLVHCFRLVIKEEGFASLYGGLTPHLLRTVPNSIIMFGTWDFIVRLIAST